jgi:tripeptide aminopeptidase
MAQELKVNEERLVNTFLELVQIAAKSKEEKPVAEYIKKYLAVLNLKVIEDDVGKKIGGNCGNLISRIPGTVMTTPAVALLSHMDTVVPCEGVKPVIRDKVIYAEGKTILGADDRAGVAAMLELATLLTESPIPHGEIELVFTVAEEIGLVGARELDKKLLHSKMSLILDGHESPGYILNSSPTLQAIKVICHGKAAHAGVCPEEGISAIEIASQAIANMKLGRIDEETTANFGFMTAGNAVNIVPEKAELEGEARSFNPDKLKKQIEHMKSCFEKSAEKFGGKVDVEIKESFQGYRVTEDQPLLQIVKKAAEQAGLTPKLKAFGGGTDGNVMNKNGIVALVLSVGYLEMHSSNEHIAIKDLIDTVRWLIGIISIINKNAWNQIQIQPSSPAQV